MSAQTILGPLNEHHLGNEVCHNGAADYDVDNYAWHTQGPVGGWRTRWLWRASARTSCRWRRPRTARTVASCSPRLPSRAPWIAPSMP